MYNSVAFSTCIVCVIFHTISFQNTFVTPEENSVPILNDFYLKCIVVLEHFPII